MGFRASVITQHREYGSNIFSDWEQFMSYFEGLRELYPDDELFTNEAEDFFEVGKEIVQDEIKRLTKLGLEEKFEHQSQWTKDYPITNKEVVEAWQRALDESPADSTYVSMEWY